ncbi:LOW QUALITY PROTEIN: transcription factor bHLH71-like [Actinidia eriantha]|uniref:LOW QUALITY PROTEIN: transcription factor bHLH71-like n=1 Tax=Actinidia eriantha TaxID=165200 RepID=UPI0025866730|nr:LOW QUALITY PROTEIN: transcription factor bHLH71-like [Actinidia eriantha]
MGLEALSTNEHFNFIIYDTFSATPTTAALKPRDLGGVGGSDSGSSMARPAGTESAGGCGHGRRSAAAQGRKKRRRRAKVCKNKEEAETQRMTHIVVERNRRKLMNEHLAVLQSLMPESYVQRGDQASIVGGAIEYVKELEHLLQSLEAQKLLVLQQGGQPSTTTTAATRFLTAPFAQFFAYPQYTWSQFSNEYNSKSKEAMADIEVTLIETHANLRILSRKNFRQLSKLVTGFQTLWLTILHLNVTTLDPLVLYSISAKVEEGCQLTSAEEIAGAVHHMLRIIEEEATLC